MPSCAEAPQVTSRSSDGLPPPVGRIRVPSSDREGHRIVQELEAAGYSAQHYYPANLWRQPW